MMDSKTLSHFRALRMSHRRGCFARSTRGRKAFLTEKELKYQGFGHEHTLGRSHQNVLFLVNPKPFHSNHLGLVTGQAITMWLYHPMSEVHSFSACTHRVNYMRCCLYSNSSKEVGVYIIMKSMKIAVSSGGSEGMEAKQPLEELLLSQPELSQVCRIPCTQPDT
eukprot:Gb_27440 [translate_table: standard]